MSTAPASLSALSVLEGKKDRTRSEISRSARPDSERHVDQY
ncbi:hypothetical protein ABZT02_40910 [Streptomyces sp. NPDC005402]